MWLHWPAVVDQEMESELQRVFIDVVSLPTMVTPVSDMYGTLRMQNVRWLMGSMAGGRLPAIPLTPSQIFSLEHVCAGGGGECSI